MEWNLVFFLNNILLGIGLAMDAFSVSLANGLSEPRMKPGKTLGIAATFAGFQALMPLLGWVCVHTVVRYFSSFERLIPWIAFLLLGYIGGKMLWDGLHHGKEQESIAGVGFWALMVQGVATSIDALSVGFTIAEYPLSAALVAVLLIAAVTFVICLCGLKLGKLFGTRLAGKATLLGGVILIGIGVEILLSHLL